MGSRAVTASLAAAVVATGCGGSGNDRRDGVQRFLQQANATEAAAAPSFNAANRAYIAFSKGKLATPTAKRDLARSEQAMRETRDRISAIAAPTDARELKRRLVALVDADAALAHETTLLAAFVPAAQAASKTLPTVGNRLTRGLRDAKGPAAQERALRTYAAALSRVIRRLVPLHPPPLLLDRHETQIQHLRRLRTLSLRLVAALKAQDSRKVAKLLLRFRQPSSAPAGSVDPSALRAYQRRVRGVQRAQQAVEKERTRLERQLP